MIPRYASDLAPEQVFDEAARILAADRARLGLTNAPIYKGQSISPMSSLTERARALQQSFNEKGAPYANKINSVLRRSNQVNPIGVQGQVDLVGRRHQNFNRSKLGSVLQNEFRSAPNRFFNKSDKDLGRGINEIYSNFGDVGRIANNLEQSSNQSLVDKLKELQKQKTDRRNALVGNLEQFGAQRHGYNNLANSINKNAFEQEANAPFKRIELLQQTLNPLSQSLGENVLPEIKAQAAKEALQALKAYGVDTNKPINEWGNARSGTTSYPGKLIANLPPEILASGETLEGISPKFKGSNSEQSKILLNQLVSGFGVGDKALSHVPERLRPQIENLESSAQKRLKKDLASINNQFIQANQYGSSLHRKSAEDRAREIAKATLEQRGRLLEDAAKSELNLAHQTQQANLRQLGIYGDQTQNEYQNMLNAIRNTNQLGSTKFANEQAENEDLYKNFQNEASWEWPHLRGAISKEGRIGALGDIFRGLESRNISLDNLASLNTNYSESQKELQQIREQLQAEQAAKSELQKQFGTFQQQVAQDIEAQRLAQQNTEKDKLAALQAQQKQRSAKFREQLKTEQAAKSELQKQLEIFQQQAKAQEEQRRVEQQAAQEAEAKKIAQQNAERERLAELKAQAPTPAHEWWKRYQTDLANATRIGEWPKNDSREVRDAVLEQTTSAKYLDDLVKRMVARGYIFGNGEWQNMSYPYDRSNHEDNRKLWGYYDKR